MRTRILICAAALSALCSAAAHAEREVGWDFGGALIYQDSQDINFNGGSRASIDDDLGLALVFAYRFSPRLELTFGMDWNEIDYRVDVASDPPSSLNFSANGDLESFTPYVGLNFNFMETDFTPYIGGTVGWAFIDTNIPSGPPQSACWWDPWYGYACGTWQETRNIDELMYSAGAGVRWDVSETISLRFGYEHRWLDLGEATSTPGFDQLRFAVSAKY
jgi:opacity protein-like surface antigen